MSHRKDQFLLDPDVVFLNHGSFGATPKPVFDVYQYWQHELERQPAVLVGRHGADEGDLSQPNHQPDCGDFPGRGGVLLCAREGDFNGYG